MRNELENIEIIEKYLRDELSASDKKAFEEKLKTDTNLQKEVELQREVVEGIKRIIRPKSQRLNETLDINSTQRLN